ncbi:MAG: hypothetical protein KGI51_15520 [Rhodospirillales bacterium]|nr:hypothetical protein [Rhodospirillales bacterium]
MAEPKRSPARTQAATAEPVRRRAGPRQPRTEAARRVLAAVGRAAAADLLFLERWESAPEAGLAAVLRARQLRRANAALAEAIREELAGDRPVPRRRPG